jgi:hypothetical protein
LRKWNASCWKFVWNSSKLKEIKSQQQLSENYYCFYKVSDSLALNNNKLGYWFLWNKVLFIDEFSSLKTWERVSGSGEKLGVKKLLLLIVSLFLQIWMNWLFFPCFFDSFDGLGLKLLFFLFFYFISPLFAVLTRKDH